MTAAALEKRDAGALLRGLHEETKHGIGEFPSGSQGTKQHTQRAPSLSGELQSTDFASLQCAVAIFRPRLARPGHDYFAGAGGQGLLERPRGRFPPGDEQLLQFYAMC